MKERSSTKELLSSAVPDARVGARLLALRKKQMLSVSKLAARAEVSAGMISQIERNRANPSIRILERLRAALGVPLSALLEDAREQPDVTDESQIVRRKAERPFFKVGDLGMTKHLLSPQGDHDLQMMIINLPSGSKSEDVLIGEGEKAGWVLAGEIVIELMGNRFTLVEGDSFQFSSTLPHSVHNNGKVEAQFLWVMNTKRPPAHL
jgi:transcriptional regulator with XRE-family HTH domain